MSKTTQKFKDPLGKIVSLALKDIVPSETNPRDHFPAEGLKELARSITEQGQLQPIIVRKASKAGKYELVAGERRFRAMSQYVDKCTHIQAVVKDLTDEETLEVQVIENLQREDVHPLAEARAFQTLLKKKDIKVVAGIIGKSTSYILKRLKLNDLSKEAQKLYDSGKMDYGHALHISRLPEDQQDRVLQWMEDEYQAPTVEDLKEHIEKEIMLEMKNAPWDLADKELKPEAGACSVCPKRTSCNKTLFDDVPGKKDLCTDADCFSDKKRLYLAAQSQKLKDQGIEKPLTGKEKQYNYGPIEGIMVGSGYYPIRKKTECESIEPVLLTETDRYSNNKKRLGAIFYICRDESCKKHKKDLPETKRKVSNKPTKRELEAQRIQQAEEADQERRQDCDDHLWDIFVRFKQKPVGGDEAREIVKRFVVSEHTTPIPELLHYHGILSPTKKEIKDATGETEQEKIEDAMTDKWQYLIDESTCGNEEDEKKAKEAIDDLLDGLLDKFQDPWRLLRLLFAWQDKGDPRTEDNMLFYGMKCAGMDPQDEEKKFNETFNRQSDAAVGALIEALTETDGEEDETA